LGHWETTSELASTASPSTVWEKAYADADAWPVWSAEIKRAELNRPLALSAKAKIVFNTGLRLRFHVVEYEEGRSSPIYALADEGAAAESTDDG
jgi:hypothetical protein